jgi:hypothetical protein
MGLAKVPSSFGRRELAEYVPLGPILRSASRSEIRGRQSQQERIEGTLEGSRIMRLSGIGGLTILLLFAAESIYRTFPRIQNPAYLPIIWDLQVSFNWRSRWESSCDVPRAPAIPPLDFAGQGDIAIATKLTSYLPGKTVMGMMYPVL